MALQECYLQSSCKHTDVAMIKCFLKRNACCFLHFCCVYFVTERKARNTYLHIHLNVAFIRVGGVGMFANSIPLYMYFELRFPPKR